MAKQTLKKVKSKITKKKAKKEILSLRDIEIYKPMYEPQTPSSALAKITGKRPVSIFDACKKIREYTRKHKLFQSDSFTYTADSKLKAIFAGKNSISANDLSDYVEKHLKK